jgi:hypothetical protein
VSDTLAITGPEKAYLLANAAALLNFYANSYGPLGFALILCQKYVACRLA